MEQDRLNKIYKATTRQIYDEFQTSAHGLSEEEAKKRLDTNGPNVIAKKKKENIFKVFFKNFTSMLAILLWVAGIISIIACFIAEETESSIGPLKDPGMLYLAIAIFLVNIINGVFSFIQQSKAMKSTEALSKMLPSYARVIRNGQEQQIEAKDLVVGDVIILSEGDRISADARILNCNDLTCNQSALDGEATPSRKMSEPHKDMPETSIRAKNIVFAGTSVSTGTARCVVIATGMDTEFGKIASLTQEIGEKKAPLEEEVEKMTKTIALIALSIGMIVFVFAVITYGVQEGFDKPSMYLQQFVVALGMIVAFIPEGLLPTVSLSLAKAVQRLAKEGALVKSLSKAETLGSTTVICSDKTGTLTKNEMTVKYLYLHTGELTVTGSGYSLKGQILNAKNEQVTALKDKDLKALLTCGALCSDAKIVHKKEENRFIVLGDPTEACLGVVAEKGLVSGPNIARIHPRIRALPFDSVRKMMTTIHQLDREVDGAQRVAYTKGSPKELIEKCSHILENGKIREINGDDVKKAMAANDKYARNGLRVLGMAFRLIRRTDKLPIAISEYTPELIENNMVFIGLEAMQDPPREGIEKAIEKCHRAGIKIIMITGDYSLTALAIARNIGIVRGEDPHVVSGSELNAMDDDQLKELLKGEIIFARMAPEQKYRIVSCLQELGEVVAVTGDGVNDAPALKKADIGIAMGIAGTDVAKDAADMILTDDNFSSIVTAIEEGRAIFANIKKFITYIFNSNVPEAIPVLIPLMSLGQVPMMLTILEVLIIDLGTDMLPALGLGSEKPLPGIMDTKPRKKSDHLITKKLYGKAFFYGMMTSVLAVFAFFMYTYFQTGSFTSFAQQPTQEWMSATSVVLASIVLCQVGMVFNCRTDEESTFSIGLLSNRSIITGIIFELVLLMVVIFVPFLNTTVLETNMILDYRIWLIMLTFPFIVVGVEELRKYIKRRKKNDVKLKKEEVAS